MKSKETQNFINSFKVLIQVITNYELEANIILKKDHRISYSEYIRLKQIRVDIEEKLKKLGGNIDYNKIIKQVRKEVIKDTSKFIIKELKQKDIDKLYSIFLEQLEDKTLKTFEETIEENGVKLAMETVFDWVILEAIPEVNNERIIPKAIKENENHWFLNTELTEEECE